MSKVRREATSASPLVGNYFHVWGPDDDFLFSGQIMDELSPDIFLVDRIYWEDRESPRKKIIVPLSLMVTENITREPAVGTWTFYATSQEALSEYYAHPGNYAESNFPHGEKSKKKVSGSRPTKRVANDRG